MASRLALRIQEYMAQLTASEKKLGQLLIERQDVVNTHSATELAAMANVSKATAARFFRALGYADFDEVKMQAREERNRTEPYQYSVAASEQIAHGRTIGEHLELELMNLRRTFEEMRSDKLTDTAALIADAPNVWFLGMGLEEGLARHARLTFARLRPNVRLLGSHDGAWAEDLAMTGPRDVLVLISVAPRHRLLTSIIDYARTSYMNIISITDYALLGYAQRYSKVVLPCHVASYASAPSSTAVLSVIRLLAIAYSSREHEATTQRLQIIEEIHEELGDLH
ncbi:MAG: MurR/RpiR family transcriptional regulator [Granulosicoccus sp.]